MCFIKERQAVERGMRTQLTDRFAEIRIILKNDAKKLPCVRGNSSYPKIMHEESLESKIEKILYAFSYLN